MGEISANKHLNKICCSLIFFVAVFEKQQRSETWFWTLRILVFLGPECVCCVSSVLWCTWSRGGKQTKVTSSVTLCSPSHAYTWRTADMQRASARTHRCAHTQHVQSKDASDCVKQALKSSLPNAGIGEESEEEAEEAIFPSQAKRHNKCYCFSKWKPWIPVSSPRDPRGFSLLRNISMVCACVGVECVSEILWEKNGMEARGKKTQLYSVLGFNEVQK